MSERLNTGKIELFILTSTQIKCEIAILGFMIGGVSNSPVIWNECSFWILNGPISEWQSSYSSSYFSKKVFSVLLSWLQWVMLSSIKMNKKPWVHFIILFYTLNSSLCLVLRGEEWESWETEAGEICQQLVALKQGMAALQVCPWGAHTHKHTHTRNLSKRLSSCHEHYNQADKDSVLLPPSSFFFLQLLPPFLSVCLSSVHLWPVYTTNTAAVDSLLIYVCNKAINTLQ